MQLGIRNHALMQVLVDYRFDAGWVFPTRTLPHVASALADRYRIERVLGR